MNHNNISDIPALLTGTLRRIPASLSGILHREAGAAPPAASEKPDQPGTPDTGLRILPEAVTGAQPHKDEPPDPISAAADIETLQALMYKQSNVLQADFARTLDSTVRQMNSLRTDLYVHLQNWQRALYPGRLLPLASCYVELCGILSSLQQADPTDQTAARLTRTLQIYLHRYEAALKSLGLYVFTPGPGTPFDALWHCEAEETAAAAVKQPRRIAACLVPGIAKKIDDDLEDDVLIRSVVRLEEESAI